MNITPTQMLFESIMYLKTFVLRIVVGINLKSQAMGTKFYFHVMRRAFNTH